jgi:hypothetical protein
MRSDVSQGANASSVNQTQNMCDDDQAEGLNDNRLSTINGCGIQNVCLPLRHRIRHEHIRRPQLRSAEATGWTGDPDSERRSPTMLRKPSSTWREPRLPES